MSRDAELIARIAAADLVLQEATGTEPGAVARVVDALLAKGEALSELGRHVEALECFRDVIGRLAVGETLDHNRELLAAMVGVGDELLALGRGVEAQTAAGAVIEAAGGLEGQERARIESRALLQTAVALGQERKSKRAVVVLADLMMRFGASPDVRVRGHVVEAMQRRAELLVNAGRADEAIDMCEGIVRLCSGADDPGLQRARVLASSEMAQLMAQAGRYREALAAIDVLLSTPAGVAALGEGEESDARAAMARALITQGQVLVAEGLTAEAIAAWHGAFEWFGERAPIAEPYVAFDAIGREVEALAAMGELDASVERFQVLLTRYGGDDREYVARATSTQLSRLSSSLLGRGRGDDAIELCGYAIESFGGVREDGSDWAIVIATLRARLLLRLGRNDEAVRAARAVANVSLDSTKRVLGFDVADRLLRLASELCNSHPADALAISRDVRTRVEDAGDRKLRELAVQALYDESIALGRLGRQAESIAVYKAIAGFGDVAVQVFDATIARTRDLNDTDHRKELAGAFLTKVSVLRILKRDREALATIDALLPLFERDGTATAGAVVGAARRFRAEIHDEIRSA